MSVSQWVFQLWHGLKSLLTWYAGAQGDKQDGRYRVLDVEGATEIGGGISDDGGYDANHEYGHHKGHIAAANVWWRFGT